LLEADDDGLYLVKFHGAGQGPKALVAETDDPEATLEHLFATLVRGRR
jgi:hypothetical protein